jgi:hypothetical protein
MKNRQLGAGGGRAAVCGRFQARPHDTDGPRSIGDGSLRMDISRPAIRTFLHGGLYLARTTSPRFPLAGILHRPRL